METQRISVTGGAGFIGTNVINELENRGQEVTAADFYNTKRENYKRENYIRADARNYKRLERIFEQSKFDYVFNLAAHFANKNSIDILKKIHEQR